MDINQAKSVLGERFSLIADDAMKILAYLQVPPDAAILDVGTGMGYFAILLALNGYRVWTGEPAADTSIYAKQDWLRNAQQVGVDHAIRFEAFDAGNMLFDDARFDAIFLCGVLHHIDEQSRIDVMNECFRTVKVGGIVCFLEPSQNGMRIIKEHTPSHPDAADPDMYVRGYVQKQAVSTERIDGTFFNMFIFRKTASL